MPIPVDSEQHNNGSSSSSQENSSTSQVHLSRPDLGLTSSHETTTSENNEANIPQVQLPTSSSNDLSENITKPWHQEVAPELRNYLVNKLVQNFRFSKPANDTRTVKLFEFARKVEVSMYEEAGSRLEYLYLIADKIYKMKKELNEKRRRINQSQERPAPTFFR